MRCYMVYMVVGICYLAGLHAVEDPLDENVLTKIPPKTRQTVFEHVGLQAILDIQCDSNPFSMASLEHKEVASQIMSLPDNHKKTAQELGIDISEIPSVSERVNTAARQMCGFYEHIQSLVQNNDTEHLDDNKNIIENVLTPTYLSTHAKNFLEQRKELRKKAWQRQYNTWKSHNQYRFTPQETDTWARVFADYNILSGVEELGGITYNNYDSETYISHSSMLYTAR